MVMVLVLQGLISLTEARARACRPAKAGNH